MALISCSVFEDKILDGTKPHTIRHRIKPPVIGENLHLWWKSRTKDKRFLGTTICTRVSPISIDPFDKTVHINERKISPKSVHALARKDGFESIAKFWEFFSEEKEASLIEWNPAYVTRSELRPDVLIHAEIDNPILQPTQVIFKPSNIDDGLGFMALWCERCDRNKDQKKLCPILLDALMSFTPHWVQHEGTQLCTSFIPKKSQLPRAQAISKKAERQGQLNLFTGAAQ